MCVFSREKIERIQGASREAAHVGQACRWRALRQHRFSFSLGDCFSGEPLLSDLASDITLCIRVK